MIFNLFSINDINAEIIEQYYQETLNEPLYFQKNDINQLNHNGSSLLFYPIVWKNVPIVNFLINNGCDINIVNNNGHSGLTWADKEIFEILTSNKNLNKEKILPSLINCIDSCCFNEDIFPLFLSIFEEEIKKLPSQEIQHINRAAFTIKQPIIEQWFAFCKSHNISSSIMDVFTNHMLNISNKLPIYLQNSNFKNPPDKQEAIDIYKNLYTEIKSKFNKFIIDLSKITEHNNQQLTSDFLLSSSIKKDMAKFLKPNEVWHNAISNHDIECALYKQEVCELYEITKLIIAGKCNKNGIPNYLLSDTYIKLLDNDWEKIHFKGNINFVPLQELLTKYSIKSLVSEKNHNIPTLKFFLDQGFSKIADILKIAPKKIGQEKLSVDCCIAPENEDIMGLFRIGKEALWVNSTQMQLQNHIKDINPDLLNNFISTFVHEYTHFLQYLDKSNPTIIFEKFFKQEWEDIVNIINYQKYSKNDISNIFINLSIDVMKKEEIVIDDEKVNSLKLYCNEYLNNQNDGVFKKIKSIIIKDKTKENMQFISLKKLFQLLLTSYKNPDTFQEEIWKNYEKIFNGKYDNKINYWNTPIEIHSRLNEEVFLNKNNSILSVGYFLSHEDRENLITSLTPKLEKFNQLLISHNEYYMNKKLENNNPPRSYKLF